MRNIVSMQMTDAYLVIIIVLACLMLSIPCMTLYGISKTNHNYLVPDIVLSCVSFGIACVASFINIASVFARKLLRSRNKIKLCHLQSPVAWQ